MIPLKCKDSKIDIFNADWKCHNNQEQLIRLWIFWNEEYHTIF